MLARCPTCLAPGLRSRLKVLPSSDGELQLSWGGQPQGNSDFLVQGDVQRQVFLRRAGRDLPSRLMKGGLICPGTSPLRQVGQDKLGVPPPPVFLRDTSSSNRPWGFISVLPAARSEVKS